MSNPNSICNINSPLPCIITYSLVLEFRKWTPLGDQFSSYHSNYILGSNKNTKLPKCQNISSPIRKRGNETENWRGKWGSEINKLRTSRPMAQTPGLTLNPCSFYGFTWLKSPKTHLLRSGVMTISLVLVSKVCLKLERYMIMIRIVIPKDCQKLIKEDKGGQEEPKT